MTNRISAFVNVLWRLGSEIFPVGIRRYADDDDSGSDHDSFQFLLMGLGQGAAAIIGGEYNEEGSKAFPDCPSPSDTSKMMEWGRRLYRRAQKEFPSNPEEVVQEKFAYYLEKDHHFSAGEKGARSADQAFNYMLSDITKAGKSTSMTQFRRRYRGDYETAREGYAHIKWKEANGYPLSETDIERKPGYEKTLREEGINPADVEPEKRPSGSDRESTIDEEFGSITEDGSSPSGGEGGLAQPTENFDWMGTGSKRLEHAVPPDVGADLARMRALTGDAFDKFYESLTEEQKYFFDFVSESEDKGGFISGTIGQQNTMMQGTKFKEYLAERDRPDILAKLEKNKNLLKEKIRDPLLARIRQFADEDLSPEAYELLYELYLGKTSPKEHLDHEVSRSVENQEFLRRQEEDKLKRALEKAETVGDDKSIKEAKRIKEKVKDWEDYGKLKWLATQRKLTKTELVKKKELELVDHVADRLDGIKPIPYDLGIENEYAEFKWKEQNGGIESMTGDELDRYDEVENILKAPPYGMDESVLLSIKTRQPGTPRVSYVIAARIAGFVGAKHTWSTDW